MNAGSSSLRAAAAAAIFFVFPISSSRAASLSFHESTTPMPANLTLAPSQTSNVGALTITIVPGPGLAGNSAALAAFDRAAQAWQARISDPISITINADLRTTDQGGGAFAPTTIGSTSTVSLTGGFDLIRNSMVTDANAQPAAANNQIVSSLPTAATYSSILPAGRSNSGQIVITKANAKALGFTGLDAPSPAGFGPSDANIIFNSTFAFDYDSSDGVSDSTIDFQTSATHEIGHALGFASNVDAVDAGLTSVSPTTLDLFRFGRLSNNPTTAAEFTSFPRDLTPGHDTITDDTTNEYRMSSGLQNTEFPAASGTDNRQASHWKDDALTGQHIGIMDPTESFGVARQLTDADFRALDLIGYDVTAVPEPASLTMIGAAFVIFLRRGRRIAR